MRFNSFLHDRSKHENIPKIYLELMMRDVLHYSTEEIRSLDIMEYHASQVYCITQLQLRLLDYKKEDDSKSKSSRPTSPGVDESHGLDPKQI